MAKARSRQAALAASAGLSVLAGCSMAPAYHPPAMAPAAAYKESGAVAGWAAAAPADAAPRGAWWKDFGDPVLDDLEARGNAASPSVAAALARYDQAAAVARRAGAERLPVITAGGDISRERLSAGRPLASSSAKYSDKSVGGALDWEIDLWGRLRDAARAGRADAQASGADLANARLSLHATIADSYFTLRGLDATIALLRDTITAYARAESLTDTRHEGGIASGLDIGRARAQLSSAKADLSEALLDRAGAEHALAVLVGENPSSFAVAAAVPKLTPIAVPAGAPATLLERRPDIAAAERRMAAANTRIGVAKAAWFPTLTLGLTGGYQNTGGNLLSASNSFWALGPLSAVATIFDGGRRSADIARSRAEYDETAADYRDTVLSAFREVEDNLAAARLLDAAEHDQRAAASAAARIGDLALTRYHDGASDYLEVVVAQTAALEAQRAAIGVQTRRLQASVRLVRALGGGFDRAAAPLDRAQLHATD
jgi:multidrug efflux system outer membrane protein